MKPSVFKYRKDQACLSAFETMMEKGATEFGGLWLAAHNAVTEVVSRLGIDYTTPQTKAVMAATVLHTLYKARTFYKGEKQ